MNKAFRYIGFLVIVLIMLSMGCSKTTSSDYDKDRINTILYNMEKAFNDNDMDAFMQYFHYDYLHNGQNKWLIRQIWTALRAEYLLIDYQNIDINVEDDEAIVSFTIKLQNQTETIYLNAPAANGDLSYFVYASSDWYVYGNQLSY